MMTRLIKLLGSLALCLIDRLPGVTWRSFGEKKPGKCAILYYHVVSAKDRVLFARQMEWLTKHCKVIPLGEFERMGSGNHACVTFDDGFISVIRNALPELEARKIPVTIFVPSGLLGQRPAWEEVEEDLQANEVVVDLPQLKALADHHLVSIGSHCISHPDLSRLGDTQAREEIVGSKVQLEKMLDREIPFLSFPFGSFTSAHIEIAAEAGYRGVLTTSPDIVSELKPNEFVMGRVKADPTDWSLEFKLKALGAYRWLPFAFSLKRTLRTLLLNRSDRNRHY